MAKKSLFNNYKITAFKCSFFFYFLLFRLFFATFTRSNLMTFMRWSTNYL